MIGGLGRLLKALARGIASTAAALFVAVKFLMVAAITIVVCFTVLINAMNLLVGVPYNHAFRALDPDSKACEPGDGWDVLADPKIGNNEDLAVEQGRTSKGEIDWEMRLRCSIQTHAIPGYQARDQAGAPIGTARPLTYDLAFLEFQENGDPYLLCNEQEYKAGNCDGTTFKPNESGAETHRGQLDALLARLKASTKNYVVVFVHGWRNTADIGGGNVADLRVYAAHAARFVADRCAWGDQRFCGMKTTAIFVGWRGGRADEDRLRRWIAWIAKPLCGQSGCWLKDAGEYLGTVTAIFTLFDRKPVSEAIAPSVIAALHAVERQIGLQGAFRSEDLAPCDSSDELSGDTPVCQSATTDAMSPQARMIVFGHSLGGNLLASGLMNEAIKLVDLHSPGDFVPPPLGNLVVLINPASEAAKWTAVQRAVWQRIAMSDWDEARTQDFDKGHGFFRDEQRPIIVSATAARDWPPGGVWPADCADLARLVSSGGAPGILHELDEEAKRRARSIDYDWATYDLFPAFRFDFRPIASSLERYAQRGASTPNVGQATTAEGASSRLSNLFDGCAKRRPSSLTGWLAHFAGAALRVFPFMNTDAEQSQTIGNLDPPRSPESIMTDSGFSARPFGTTHQLEGWDSNAPAARRTRPLENGAGVAEETVGYADVITPDAECPLATGWLTKARKLKSTQNHGYAQRWDAADLPRESRPSLRFVHGFYPAHLSPITRENDPFWNLRALDNALAEHDGYMLSSFICAMQQLVLDDITDIPPTKSPSHP